MLVLRRRVRVVLRASLRVVLEQEKTNEAEQKDVSQRLGR
jgi:hypothetical protein